MSSLLRLLINVFSLLITELVNIAIRVVFTAFLVRYLWVSDFGIYTTITVFLAFGASVKIIDSLDIFATSAPGALLPFMIVLGMAMTGERPLRNSENGLAEY